MYPKGGLGGLPMVDFVKAREFAHHANIKRYRRLLRTHLTDVERQFLERRLAEEQAALRQMAVAMPRMDAPSNAA